MIGPALQRFATRLTKMIRKSPKTTLELLNEIGVDNRELVMGFIKRGRQSGLLTVQYRESGEPEYSLS